MSKLTQILEDQIAAARTNAGAKIIRKLKNGLRIEIVYINTVVYLTLTRDGQFPSMQEWDTVVRHMPFATPRLMPATDQNGPRHTLTARLPITAEQQKFL
jgi:hypothetical protein